MTRLRRQPMDRRSSARRPSAPVALGIALLACGLAAACSSSSGGSSADPSTTTAAAPAVARDKTAVAQLEKPQTTVGTTVPMAKAPPRGKTVVAMACQGSPACALYLNSFKAAGAVLGWKVITIAFTPTPEQVLSEMKYALSLHPDGIVINGVARSEFEAAFKDETGKPVPVVEQEIGDSVSPPVVAVQFGNAANYSWVAGIGKWAVANSNGNVHALYVTFANFPIEVPGVQGATNAIMTACPKTCSVHTLYVQVGSSTIPNQVASYVQAHPQTNYVLFSDATLSTGVYQALRGAGVAKGVTLAGLIPGTNGLADINSGVQKAYLTLPLAAEAWAGLDALARYFNDESQPTWSIPDQLMVKGNFSGIPTDIEPSHYAQTFAELWQLGK